MKVLKRSGALLAIGIWLTGMASPARASVMSGSLPNPRDVDLLLWLAADALQLANGAGVARWPDLSDKQHAMVGGAGGAALPTFTANRLNGLPGVVFEGRFANLIVPEGVDLGQEHTIIVVGRARSSVPQHVDAFLSYAANTRGASEMDLGVEVGRGLRARYLNLDASQPSAAGLEGATVFAQVRAAPSVRGYVGDPASPVLNVSARTREISTIGKTLRIGAFGRTTSYLAGDVHEILVYRRALSALELAEVFDYLKHKWQPTAAALARVVLDSDSGSSPFDPQHSPDVWYRDRGATACDLLDGALDFSYRGGAPSTWAADSFRALELDGGAGGLKLALRSTGRDALQLELGLATGPFVTAAASGVSFAADTRYHLAATIATGRDDGRVTARLFAAPDGVPIDTSSKQFEIASAISASPLDTPANDAVKHAFGAGPLPGLRIWRGVPDVIRPRESLPDAVDVVHPDPEPALPAGFDPFDPPVSAAAPVRDAPQLAEWTRSATAADAIVLTGERLSSLAGDAEGEDTAFTMFGQNAESLNMRDAEILRQDGRRAALRIDPALPTAAMYLLWPQNRAGYGRPVALNRSEAWWLGPNRAARSESVSVYGRNLSHDAGTSSAFVYLKAPGKQPGQWLTPSHVNPYKLDVVLPSDLASGTYEIWTHNGHGGRYGWSRPLTLTVDDGQTWSGATFDVQADGDEAPDDAQVQAALDAAQKSVLATGKGATVRFSAGTFYLTRTLELPSSVRLIGAGKDATQLRGKGSFGGRRHFLWINAVHDNELADLTLDFAGATHSADGYLISGSSRDLHVHDVRFVALGDNQYVIYHGSERARYERCDFIGPMLIIINGSQVFFDHCRFYGTRDGILLYASAGVRELSVTHCTGQDYDVAKRAAPNGWSQGRFVNIVNRSRVSRDVYIGDNTTYDLGVNPDSSNLNTGEQISWDEAQGQFIALAASATNDTVTFARPAPPLDPEHSSIAVIVAGRGEGQSRDVLAIDGKRVTVASSWNVLPDKTSKLVLGSFHERAVVYRNHLDGKLEQSFQEGHTGSSGIEPYGGMSNFVADANSVTDCRHGLYVMGVAGDVPSAPAQMLPSLFQLYTGNLLQGSRRGAMLGTGGNIAGEIGAYGYVFRGNSFLASVEGVGFIIQDARTDNMDMVVFDRTLAVGTPIGFNLYGPGASTARVGNVLLLNNHLERGAAKAEDSSAVIVPHTRDDDAPDSHLWSQGNTWANFARSYTGSPATPAPLLPVRRLFAFARRGAEPSKLRFSVLNIATREMKYAVKLPREAPWLSAPEPQPTIPQHDSAIYELSCDPKGLRPGVYRASVEVGDARKRSLSVSFRVLP